MPAPVVNKPKIVDVRHPFYSSNLVNWIKFRLVLEGGDRFINKFLKRLSKREDDQDFQDRRAVTYNPGFAKVALNDVKNAVFQRMVDVARVGGDETYQAAVEGEGRGVDMVGATMSAFVGRRILPELLAMGRVGIYVDMPALSGPTKLDAKGKHPYLYWYPAEDILSWNLNEQDEFTELLLMDSVIESDSDGDFFLPYSSIRRYRHVWIGDDGHVRVQMYGDTEDGEPILEEPVTLGITKIPFVLAELSDSLLMDAANYQIAHLNLVSSDMAYLLRANFPFYVEQFDPRTQSQYLKNEAPNQRIVQSTNAAVDPAGNYQITANQDKVSEVKVGMAAGRRYPAGMNQPAFIHPSTDPVHASMAKQDQIKQEIRELVLGAVAQLAPTAGTPAGTNEADNGLEAGLAYIGLELQHAERQIAAFWALYVGGTAATVHYPESYELKTDADRRAEAADLEKLMAKLPSKTYQRAIAKRMARVLLGPKVSAQVLATIDGEIDAAVVVTTDPDIVATDFEAGFVGLETASAIRGYPKGEVAKAKQDHADRVARIAIAQSKGGGMGAENPQARGVPDASADPAGGRSEKTASRDTTLRDSTRDPVRGGAS